MADLNLDQVRTKYPQYNDMSDDALVHGLYQKFYSDLPFDAFAGKLGYALPKQAPDATAQSGLSAKEKYPGFTYNSGTRQMEMNKAPDQVPPESTPAPVAPPVDMSNAIEFGPPATAPAPDNAPPNVGERAYQAAAQAWNETPPLLKPEEQNTLTKIAESGGVKGFLAGFGSTAMHDLDILRSGLNASFRGSQELIRAATEPILGPQGARDLAALPEAFPTGFHGGPHAARLTAPERAAMAEARSYAEAPLTVSSEPGETAAQAAGRNIREEREALNAEMERAAAARQQQGQLRIAGPQGEATPEPVAQPTTAPTPRPMTPEQAALDEETAASSPAPAPLHVDPESPHPVPPPAEPSPAPTASGAYVMVDPRQLTVDAARFQFKAAGEGGVTGALHGINRWEPALANPITAWQGNDGNLYVINGHQRTDLALRAQQAGQSDVAMPARIFRESDGYTPDYMRALGAYQNMAEGSGTAIDAAKVLRSENIIPGDRRLPDLPPRGQIIQQASALAKLSDEAFGVIENGIVPPGYAAHVGALIADPTEQMAALDMLARAQPANSEQARMMVQDIRDSGFLRGSQTTLFGDEDFARSLVPERARVLDNALRSLRRLKSVFRAAVEGEENLTAAGNTLDRESNIQGRTDNEQLLDRLQRNATTRGPISDALSTAARDLADGKPIAGVSSRFLAEARRLVRSGQDQGVRPGDIAHGEEPAREASPAVDLLGRPIPELATPRTPELTIHNDPNQATMPGMESSAVQAQAARDTQGRGGLNPDAPQQPANEGLFAPDTTGQGTLYSFPGMLFDPALWRRVFASIHPSRLPNLGHMNVDILADKQGLPRLMAEVKSQFSPTSLKGARPMELAIRKHGAEAALAYQRAVATLWSGRQALGRLSKQDQIGFTHRMETGQPQPNPQLQVVADTLRTVIDDWTQKVQGMGKGYLQHAIQDYMGHIWGNYREWAAGQPAPHASQMVGPARAGAQGKRPLQGSGAFLKQRAFPTQQDGINAGLIPVTYNPVDLQLLKLREMQKFYYGSKLAEFMKASGLATWVPVSDWHTAPHQGYEKLDDRVFQPMIQGAHAAGPVIPGAYFAIEPQARLFNRYMSRGIAGQSLWYDTARMAGNALNSIQLAWPGFHTAFVTMDTANSRFALGLQQLARGQVGQGAASLATGVGPGAVMKSLVTGTRLRRALLDPATATPEYGQLADDFIMAGGRISMDRFYQSSATGSFIHGWRDFDPRHIAAEVAQIYRDTPPGWRKAIVPPITMAFRALDTLMHPLMGILVPRAKIGVFGEMARQWHETHSNALPEDRAAAMTTLWDNVEDRLGQMTYDNIFWHKALKDIAFLGFRSVGWNLGTVRAGAGAAADTGQFAADAARLRKPEFTGRMAYGIAQFANQALWGAMLTYMLTGSGPQDWMDYLFPRTGGTTPQGDPERLSMPGYVKDWIDWAKAPGQTLANKVHPLVSLGLQISKNRDYYGGLIDTSGIDSNTSMAAAYGDFLANSVLPFTLRGYERMKAEDASSAAKTLSLFGFQMAPKSIVAPERGEAFQTKEDIKAYRRLHRELGRQHFFTPNPASQPAVP